MGEFLLRTRLSPKALRLYEDQGLIRPDRVDPHSGYRWYDPAQVGRARTIGLLRRAGMPLARVRQVVDLAPGARRAIPRCCARPSRSLAPVPSRGSAGRSRGTG